MLGEVDMLGSERRSGGARGSGRPLPVAGYDLLTVRQVSAVLPGLTAAQLRVVQAFERRHANRKSVLAMIERALG
jgi:hypothetical protein